MTKKNALRPAAGGRPPSPVLGGLLLGLLLTLFIVVFIYVGYLFLSWGQSAAAGAHSLPPLSLPKLVRLAPESQAATHNAPEALARPAAGRPQEAAPAVSGRVTVLVMGVDNRPDETVARTDSIMVVTVNPQTGATGILSLPRDLLVAMPGTNEPVKINTVHFNGELRHYPGGGPVVLRTVVSQLIGYPIDYYVRINFDGFRQIIDLIGGVDIDVPKEINDPLYPNENYGYDPLYIPTGRQHMNGALALKYARTRSIDSDYGRAGRQQQVVLAVKDKVMQPGQLAALLPRLPNLALAMANSIQTDMPVERALTLARTLGQSNLKTPTQVVVDNTLGQEVPDYPLGAPTFVLIPDLPRLRAAAAAIFADAVAGPSAAETLRQKLQTEAASVIVLNGTAEEGLAAKIAATLTAEGLTVIAIGNADRADYLQTVLITYGNRTPATRDLLARRYNIPADRIRSEPPADGKDLAVILGSDAGNK